MKEKKIENRDRWVLLHLPSYRNIHHQVLDELKKNIYNSKKTDISKKELNRMIKIVKRKFDIKLVNSIEVVE